MAKSSIGSRGKDAETRVNDELVKLNREFAIFDYQREYDARSAGGRFQARVADFLWFMPSLHGAVEVKEVAHDYRLPKKNFKLSQRARLRARERAGGNVMVLVHHSTSSKWRYVPLSVFDENAEGASWNLAAYPTVDSVQVFFEPLRELLKARSYEQ